MTHICVSKLSIIGSDNGLSPSRRQAIIWTDAGILLIRTLGTNFNEILSEIHAFSFKKMHLKMSSAKWRPFCLGLNVLKTGYLHSCSSTTRATSSFVDGSGKKPASIIHSVFEFFQRYIMSCHEPPNFLQKSQKTLRMGSRDKWEFQLFFRPQWQSLCTALAASNCLPLGLCKGTVKESNYPPSWARYGVSFMNS